MLMNRSRYGGLLARLLILLSSLAPLAAAQQDPPGTKYPAQVDSANSLFDVRDRATTVLKVTLTSTATTMTVTSTAGFPDGGSLVVDNREWVWYTGRTSTQFTGLIRGQAGTAALTHTAGVIVDQRIIADHHNYLRDGVIATQRKLGAGAGQATSGALLTGTGSATSAWRVPSSADVTGWLGYTPADSAVGLTLTAFGGNNNGAAFNDAAFAAAISAAASAHSPIYLKGGVYLIQGPIPGTASGIRLICPTGDCIIRKAAGGATAALLHSSYGLYINWKFEGIEFDGNQRDAGVAAEPDFTANASEWRGTEFVDCKFRDFSYHQIPTQGSSHLRFTRCKFYGTRPGVMQAGTYDPAPNASAAYGSATQLNFGSEDIVFDGCEFHFVVQGVLTSNSSGADPTVKGVRVLNSKFRGDWWNSPYKRGSWAVSAVPNGASGDYFNSPAYIDIAAGSFAGFFDNKVISFPILIANGSSLTGTFAQIVIAPGIGAGVQFGDSIETADGKRAEIVGVDSANEVQIAGWEDYATYEPTSPPASLSVAWRVRRYFASIANFVSNTRIQLYQTPVNPYSGETILHAGVSLVGKTFYAFADTIYSGVHFTASKDVLVEGCTLRGSFADEVSSFNSEGVRVTGNYIALTQDEAVTLTNTPGAVVTNNSFFRVGTSSYIGSDNVTFSNNSFDGWQIHYQPTNTLGAISVNGKNTVVSGNTFRYPTTAGFAPNSSYTVSFAVNGGDSTGSIASNNNGSGNLGQVYVASGSGPVAVRDSTVSGPNAAAAVSSFVALKVPALIESTVGGFKFPDGTTQTTAAGAIQSLNGQTGATQTFTNDTNVQVVSASNAHAITWVGTLAKPRQNSATVYNDQANTFGNFVQTFQGGANFLLADPTDTTKKIRFDASNIATATTRTVNVPDANSTTAQAATAPSHQFFTAMSAQGVFGSAQPAFSDISGSVAASQMPALTGDVTTSAGGVATTIGAQAVTYSKIQNVSATARVLGRNTAGAGVVEELATLPAGVQDNITRLGVIGSGTWQGTAIADGFISSASSWNSKQAGDADLTAIAALTGTGFGARTAADTWALRSVAVGSNLSVSNADGASGNPTISLGSNVVTSVANDTNVTGSISSNQLTLGWTGTLAKARQHAATVYNDAGNTYSTGAQDFGAATSLKVPTAAGAAPTANGLIAYDSTANAWKAGVNGAGKTLLMTDGNGSALTSLNGSNIASGTVAVGVGGTGQTSYTDGQLLIGNSSGNTLTKSTLTAGAGVSVTNGNGSITVASTGELLLATVSGVDMQNASKSNLYTVPTGKHLIVTRIIIRSGTDFFDDGRYGFGFDSGASDLIGSVIGPATGKATVVPMDSMVSADGFVVGNAGQNLGIASQGPPSASGTATVMIFGILY